MDEAMKRRIVGVLVVVAVVFVISLLLPNPGTVRSDENNQHVTLDLTGKDPEPSHAPMTPVPPVIAAAPAKEEPKAEPAPGNDGAPPQIEEPPVASNNMPAESMTDDEPVPPKAQKPAEATPPKPSKPKVETVVAAATPDKPAQTTQAEAKSESKPAGPKPALKMEESLKQKMATTPPARPVEKTPPKVIAKAPEPAAKAKPAAPAKPAAAVPAKSHWFVQVGAFGSVDNAHQVLDKLGTKGLKGLISPLDSDKGTRYRVRIGPFATRDQAKQAQDHASKLGYSGSSVLED